MNNKNINLHYFSTITLLCLFFFPLSLMGNHPLCATANYCPSSSDFPWEDWISKIEINGLSNTSGKTSYSDFTNETVILNSGSTYEIKLTTGFSYFTTDEYWRVWIDYNSDGDFDENLETVYEGILTAPADGTPNATLSAMITIPPGAPEFSTRMRVSMTRGGYAESCDVLAYGEVEDYTVNITNTNALPDLSVVSYEFIPGTNSLCYTEPGTPYFNFGVTLINGGFADAGAFKVSVFWSEDEEVSSDDILWKELQFSGLAAGIADGFNIDDPVPASIVPGRHNVIVFLDADDELLESDENNNNLISLQRLGAPDFAIQSITGIPNTLMAGNSFTTDVILENIAPFPLTADLQGGIFSTMYLSTEPIFNSTTATEIGAFIVLFNDFTNPPLYLNGTNLAPISSTIPASTPAGDYYIFVEIERDNCEKSKINNISDAIPIQISGGNPGTYCTSVSDFPWQEWISEVEVADLSNSSEKSTYSDFTSQTANLSIGEFYTIKLTSSYSYFTEDEYWRVWVDLNQDGDFEDQGEMVRERVSSAPPDGTPSKSIQDGLQIPVGTMEGTTRMRIAMKRGAFPTSCETLPFGEVEDYTLNLTNSGGLPNLASPSYEIIPGGTFLCYTDIGESFAFFGVTIVNFGIADANPFKVKATWSKDDQLSSDDLVWEEIQVDAIQAGYAEGIRFSKPVPTALDPGRYYVFIEIDSDNEVTEPNELDNIIRARQTIGAPDFIIDDVTGIPTSISAGGDLNATIDLRNISPFPLLENTGTIPVELYLSEDAELNFSQDLEIGSVNVASDQFSNPPFYDNGTTVANLLTSIPSNIAEGDYFLFARIRLTCEKNALNNSSVGYPIQITNGNPGTYCNTSSAFPWHEWIAGVNIANLDNTSNKSSYSDFTNLSVNVDKENGYPITLTTGFSYFTEDQYWSVWMDLNQNQVFENSELMYSRMVDAPADGIGTFPIDGFIYIPTDALIGSTRMRVAMKRGDFATPCETLSFGEVEDYTVIISSAGPSNRESNFAELNFDIEQKLNEVHLSGLYQSTFEIENFVVEKSVDGTNFEILEDLSPTNNLDGLHWMDINDLHPQDGQNFYRVFIKLKNGKEIYSSIKSLNYSAPNDFIISPNPARSQITVALENPTEQEIHWSIKNLHGQNLWSNQENTLQSSSFQIDINHLVPGVYYLVGMRTSGKVWSKRFVVVE